MKIPKILKNKFALALIFFVIWGGFIDDNNLVRQFRVQHKVAELEKQKQHYLDEIDKTQKQLDEINKDDKSLEKFLRESFMLKRENEDLFIIVEEE